MACEASACTLLWLWSTQRQQQRQGPADETPARAQGTLPHRTGWLVAAVLRPQHLVAARVSKQLRGTAGSNKCVAAFGGAQGCAWCPDGARPPQVALGAHGLLQAARAASAPASGAAAWLDVATRLALLPGGTCAPWLLQALLRGLPRTFTVVRHCVRSLYPPRAFGVLLVAGDSAAFALMQGEAMLVSQALLLVVLGALRSASALLPAALAALAHAPACPFDCPPLPPLLSASAAAAAAALARAARCRLAWWAWALGGPPCTWWWFAWLSEPSAAALFCLLFGATATAGMAALAALPHRCFPWGPSPLEASPLLAHPPPLARHRHSAGTGGDAPADGAAPGPPRQASAARRAASAAAPLSLLAGAVVLAVAVAAAAVSAVWVLLVFLPGRHPQALPPPPPAHPDAPPADAHAHAQALTRACATAWPCTRGLQLVASAAEHRRLSANETERLRRARQRRVAPGAASATPAGGGGGGSTLWSWMLTLPGGRRGVVYARLRVLAFWAALLGGTLALMPLLAAASSRSRPGSPRTPARRPPGRGGGLGPAGGDAAAGGGGVPLIIVRKGYHLLALLILVPAMHWDPALVSVSRARGGGAALWGSDGRRRGC